MLTQEKCCIPQAQCNVTGNEAPCCSCTASFYFELSTYVKSVTIALSLLGYFFKLVKWDCTLHPVQGVDCSQLNAPGSCCRILQQSMDFSGDCFGEGTWLRYLELTWGGVSSAITYRGRPHRLAGKLSQCRCPHGRVGRRVFHSNIPNRCFNYKNKAHF